VPYAAQPVRHAESAQLLGAELGADRMIEFYAYDAQDVRMCLKRKFEPPYIFGQQQYERAGT